jgi:hypothetical protein
MEVNKYSFIFVVILFGMLDAPSWADSKKIHYANNSSATNRLSDNDNSSLMENTRWAIDVSTRQIRNLETDDWSSQDAYGFDFHKVFSNVNGDYGTLIFQPYLVHLNNISNPPFFFDDGDDWELTWRIVNFNYTGLSNGKFNVRIGHFEIPFGLEQNIDTNGTLRQYTFSNRGIKVDWGASINGNLPKLDYELALTRGSSNEFLDRDDPYIFSGRIGTPSHQNTIYGFSYFYGDVLAGKQTIRRKQLGLDIAHYYKQWEFLSEVSGGENNDVEVINWLGEISWRNLYESIHVFTQTKTEFSKLNNKWEDGLGVSIGIDWQFHKQLSLGSQITHEFDNPTSSNADLTASFQLRARI